MAWAPEYVDLADFREYVRVHSEADDADDQELEDALAGAHRAVDGECLRQFGNSGGQEARYYVPRWSKTRGAWRVDTDDFPVLVGLTVHLDTAGDGSFATQVTSFLPRPANADRRGHPWEGLVFTAPSGVTVRGVPDEVRVTAPAPAGFGWAAVPRTIKLASKIQANRFLTRRDAPYGVAGSPEQGSELRLLAKVDPDVAVMLRTYRRRVGAR